MADQPACAVVLVDHNPRLLLATDQEGITPLAHCVSEHMRGALQASAVPLLEELFVKKELTFLRVCVLLALLHVGNEVDTGCCRCWDYSGLSAERCCVLVRHHNLCFL